MFPTRSSDGNFEPAMLSHAQQTSRVAELEAENASLQARLSDGFSGIVDQQDVEPEERYQSLATKYNDLFKQYGDLEARHKRCDLHIELVENKYRRAKDIVRQWSQYIEYKKLAKHELRSRHDRPATPKGLSDAPNDELPAVPDPSATPRAASYNQDQHSTQAPHADNAIPDRCIEQALVDPHNDGPTEAQRSQRTSALRVTSSQTTDAGSDPADIPSSPPGKHGHSSDSEPVVVSARSLKRKRSASSLAMPPPIRIKKEPGSPDEPIEVKSEDYSSPALVHRKLARNETSDLDAIVGHPITPKKDRRDRRALSEEGRRPPPLSARLSSLSDGDLLEGESESPPNEIRLAKLDAMPDHDLEVERTDPALQPISINIPTNRPHFKPAQKSRKGRQSDQEAATKAALLSEDGESQSVGQTTKPAQLPRSRPAERGKAQRLDSLLKGPQFIREQLTSSHTPKAVAPRPKDPLTPVSLPAAKTAPTSKSSSKPQITPSYRRRADATPPSKSTVKRQPRKSIYKPDDLEQSPPPVRPEDEPLRLRPFTALRLEDFRINPQYTGENYAYSETVRGAARKCLPGCTRPDCCGGVFMKAVQLIAPLKDDKSDAEVLEAYFGPSWQAIVGAYPADRRKSLLQEARASAFANQYGKHRNAFERQGTPPGFWRTDMPSTQEANEYRAQAEAEKKVQVETRWREAMRGGGRWKFRDE
ncbi:hypothetical protein LTR86_000361 [Recurvomyces mirabilis]|nr:hypothetical protein LTR86_000361 [Recurvomyces mirabilis]